MSEDEKKKSSGKKAEDAPKKAASAKDLGEKKAKPEAKDEPKKEKGAPKKEAPNPYQLNAQWSGLWKVFAGIAAVGLVGAGVGYTQNPTRFAYSWMFGFLVALTIPIGAMMWILIQYLTSAAWSVTVRRTAEFFGSGSVVFVVLVIPIILSMNTLFGTWLHASEPGTGEQHALTVSAMPGALAQNEHGTAAPVATDHGAPVVPKGMPQIEKAPHGDPDELIEEHIMSQKTWWLTRTLFIARAVLFVLIWAVMGWWLLNRSTMQDKSKEVKLTVETARAAPVLTIVLALSLTFAAFDWIMSLEPTWYSTIFGVNFFASSVVAIHAVLIVTLMSMRDSGMLVKEVNVEHYHDLGKLQFGFLIFWGYISFSQFMLIWYAAIPEENTFYHHRWDAGPWAIITTGLIVAHFVIPFFLILSRNAKRKIEILRVGALIILTMHVIEIYWFVMPNVPKQEEFAFSWIDAACLVGVVCTYLAAVFRTMASHNIIPTGDPRLSRSLKFVNA